MGGAVSLSQVQNQHLITNDTCLAELLLNVTLQIPVNVTLQTTSGKIVPVLTSLF